MKSDTSSLRRAYDALALFAVLNLLGMAAAGAYLVNSGVVDESKMTRIVDVLRGVEEEEAPDERQTEAEKVVESDAPKPPQLSAVGAMNLEVVRREAARIEAELDQRLAQVNNILIRVTAEREAFQREKKQTEQQQLALKDRRAAAGFARQVEIYESLAPKIAVEHMLSMPNPDDAARLLMQMDARKAKKIVESAKRPKDMERMKEIMQRLREVAPGKSNEIAG